LVRKRSNASFSNLAPNVLSPIKHQLFPSGKELQSEAFAKGQGPLEKERRTPQRRTQVFCVVWGPLPRSFVLVIALLKNY